MWQDFESITYGISITDENLCDTENVIDNTPSLFGKSLEN